MALGPMVNFILADHVKLTMRGEESQMFPVQDTVDDVYGGETGYRAYLNERIRRGVQWEAEATTQSMFHLQSSDPNGFIHRITAPILMILAEKDVVNPLFAQLEMFERISSKQREMFMLKGNHFDVYYGKGLEEVMETSLRFLARIFP